MSALNRRRHAARTWAAGACVALCCQVGWAQSPPSSAASAPQNSRLDAPLFYQLLIGEIELNAGHPGNAYAVMLDAARRTRDEQLFRLATEIALRARAGEQALAATQAWRTALPKSTEALQLQVQILLSLNRPGELNEPLGSLLKLTPVQDRAAVIASLPRFMLRAGDKQQAARILQSVLQPYADDPATAVAVKVANARAWLGAGDTDRAWQLAQEAHAAAPAAAGPVLLAMELMPARPEAEALVNSYLDSPDATVAVRRAYASTLINARRYADAIVQLQAVTRQQPDLASAWLTLGALQVEMRQSEMAEQSLQRYLLLAQAPGAAALSASAADAAHDSAVADGEAAISAAQGPTQAWLLLAQAAEQRGDYAAANGWLDHVSDPQRALEVQIRRASLLAKQGKMAQARELLHAAPEQGDADARAKLLAEAQLLRRVMVLKPDYAHAYNALGYSLADRGIRLKEAKELIERALALSPGDPFITDSLGWVEFRMGNSGEAIRLLQSAYRARPDTEIAAHLGEVLWAAGRRDEARQVWADAARRDADNTVLRETLARLKAQP